MAFNKTEQAIKRLRETGFSDEAIKELSRQRRLAAGKKLFDKKIKFLTTGNNSVESKAITAWLKSPKGFAWFVRTDLNTIKGIKQVLSRHRLSPIFPVVIAAHMRGTLPEKTPSALSSKLNRLFAHGSLYHPNREKLKMLLVRKPHLVTFSFKEFQKIIAHQNKEKATAIKKVVAEAQLAGLSGDRALKLIEKMGLPKARHKIRGSSSRRVKAVRKGRVPKHRPPKHFKPK